MSPRARVTLATDRDTFLLGENVLVHYCLANTGDAPFDIEVDGDYNMATRALGYKVSVIDDTASAVQEQAIASDEIARNMDAVQRIASDVLASSENAVQEGDRLQKLADELEQSVKGFRIDPERVALDEAELKVLPEGKA